MTKGKHVAAYLDKNLSSEYKIKKSLSFLPEAVQTLIHLYASNPSVRLILLIGSVAKAKNSDKHSDIDIVLVCGNEGIPTTQQRLATINHVSGNSAVIQHLDTHIWNFGTADDFTLDGQEVCTQFFTQQFMDEKIEQTIDGFYTQMGMEHPLAALASLMHAMVIVDKDDLYSYFTAKLDPYPEKLRRIILEQEQHMRFPYYMHCLDTAIHRDDRLFAHKMITNALDSVSYILFAKHRHFPKGPKRLSQQIATIDPDNAEAITSLVATIIATPTNEKTLRETQQNLTHLFKLVAS